MIHFMTLTKQNTLICSYLRVACVGNIVKEQHWANVAGFSPIIFSAVFHHGLYKSRFEFFRHRQLARIPIGFLTPRRNIPELM